MIDGSNGNYRASPVLTISLWAEYIPPIRCHIGKSQFTRVLLQIRTVGNDSSTAMNEVLCTSNSRICDAYSTECAQSPVGMTRLLQIGLRGEISVTEVFLKVAPGQSLHGRKLFRSLRSGCRLNLQQRIKTIL